MKPLNGNIILKEIEEDRTFKGIILPKEVSVNKVMFAQIVALPNNLNTKNLKEGQYVILGYSPIWAKKYRYKYQDEYYFIVNEYAILGIIHDKETFDLLNVGKGIK